MIKKVKVRGKLRPVYFGMGAIYDFKAKFKLDLLDEEDISKMDLEHMFYMIQLGLEWGAKRAKTENLLVDEEISFLVDDHPLLINEVMAVYAEGVKGIVEAAASAEKKRKETKTK